MWLKLFVLACLALASASCFSVDLFVGLSVDLQQRLHVVSWFLVGNGSLTSDRQVTLLHKTLASTLGKVKVTHVTLDNLNLTAGDCQCSENRPMFVLFRGEDTKQHLKLQHKIPCYPRWLIYLDSASELDSYFDHVYVPFDCEFLVAVQVGAVIQLTEIYHLSDGWPLNARHYGTWEQGQGLVATRLALYERRRDLQGVKLKAIAMEYFPEVVISKAGGSQDGLQLEGLNGNVWTTMETLLNFTTLVKEVPFGDFGTLRNGTWTGMLANVVNDGLDVGINGFTYDKERMLMVNFITPILLSRAHLYVIKPTGVRSRWNGVLAPFTNALWVGVVAGVVVSGVWLAASFRIGRLLGVEERPLEDIDLASALFNVLAIYCAQNSSCSPRAASSRAVLLLAGLCAAVVCAAYASALTSSLAVGQPALAHQTIREYVDDPVYDIEMSPSSFWIYVDRPRNSLLRALYTRMAGKADDMPRSRLAGVVKLCTSTTPYGWFATKNIPYELLRSLNCEIVAVPGHLVVNTESMIVPKGSPYRGLFNYYVNYLRSSGVLEVMRQRAWPRALVHTERGSPKVQLHQVLPTFGILALGVAVSLLLLGQELVASRWR